MQGKKSLEASRAKWIPKYRGGLNSELAAWYALIAWLYGWGNADGFELLCASGGSWEGSPRRGEMQGKMRGRRIYVGEDVWTLRNK